MVRLKIIDNIKEISHDVSGIARDRDDGNPWMTMARFSCSFPV